MDRDTDRSVDVQAQWTATFRTKVIFGGGAVDRLADVCRAYGTSALLVTGQSAVRTGLARRCLELLDRAHIRTGSCHWITADPTVHQVNEIARLATRDRFDMLVAVGGGSSLDAAKAAAVIAGDGSAEEYLTGERPVPARSRPVIAVPTTAGTGAELSRAAIISWPEENMKGGIRGDALYPVAAVVDPQLTLTLPLHQVRLTGFDALTHAVETYVSRQANPITAMFSETAVKSVSRHLPAAVRNLDDLQARTQLSLHSMLMGYNLANSSTCLPHRMQYPLGVMTQTSHAVGLAALFPAWVRLTHDASPDKFRRVAAWLAEGLGTSCEQRSGEIVPVLSGFMQAIGLEITLMDLGVDADMCDRLANRVRGTLANDPWWHEGVELSTLYRAALSPIAGAG